MRLASSQNTNKHVQIIPVVKNLPANAGDMRASSIPGSGRSPGRGCSSLLQYSCGNLEMWASSQADGGAEINATHSPDKDLLQVEPTDDQNVSLEDDTGESSQSSYDDPSMMQLYNETNRQLTLLHSSADARQAAPDNLDTWNRVILEDTQSTATISDMDNDLDWDDCSAGVAITGEGQAQGYMAAQVVAWPPRLSAGRRGSGSQRP